LAEWGRHIRLSTVIEVTLPSEAIALFIICGDGCGLPVQSHVLKAR
jgi:hypothetical protein